MKKESILKKINNSFGDMSKKHDFEVKFNAVGVPFFLHRTNDTTLRIAPSIGRFWENENYFEASGAHADMRMSSVENLWEENASILNISANKNIGLHTYHVSTLDVYPELVQTSNASENKGWQNYNMTDKGISQYIEMTDFLLEKKILPRIKQLNDIKTLDKSINSKVELNDNLNTYFLNSKGLIFRRTILAKLSGNTFYEDICEYQRTFFSEYEELSKQKQHEYFKNYPIVFEKLYDKLNRL